MRVKIPRNEIKFVSAKTRREEKFNACQKFIVSSKSTKIAVRMSLSHGIHKNDACCVLREYFFGCATFSDDDTVFFFIKM